MQSYADKLIAQGLKEGVQKGRAQGRAELAQELSQMLARGSSLDEIKCLLELKSEKIKGNAPVDC